MRVQEKSEKIIRPDSKGRINLGKMAAGISGFKVSLDKKTNRLILDPYKEIPLYEKWLFENKEALLSVKKNLLESSKGKLKDRGRFSEYIKEN